MIEYIKWLMIGLIVVPAGVWTVMLVALMLGVVG